MTDAQKQIIQDKANLVVKAGGREVGYLQAFNPQETVLANQPKFTVDRNCKRTEIDSELYIRQIAPYMPAFSWVDGKPTIDTQPDAINQILYPFDVGNAYYTESNLTVDDNAGAFYNSPFKDSTGNVIKCGRKLVESDASAGSVVHQLRSSKFTYTTTTTLSFTQIVKPNGRNFVRLFASASEDSSYYNTIFDIKNKVIVSESNCTGKIQERADGFVEISITFLVNVTTSTDVYAYIYLYLDATTPTYTGDGVSGVYIAGIQFETGNPTAFINNPADAEGSTAGRLGELEVATYNGSSESGTLIANMGAWDTINSSAFKTIKINDGTSSNQIYLYYYGNALAVDIAVGGITITLSSDVSDITNKNNMIAVRWKQDNVSLWYNGTKIKETLSWNTFGANILNKITLAFAGDSKVIETTDYLTDSELIELMA